MSGGPSARKLAAFLVIGVVVVGCGSGTDEDGEQPGDEATKQELAAAYAALERAADELSAEDFASLQRSEARKARRGVDKLTSTGYFGLVRYLSESGSPLGVTLADPTDQAELDNVLAGIEFNDDPKALTLIAPRRLGHSPPAELIESGVMFAAISPSGTIFCLGPDDEEPRPCQPAALVKVEISGCVISCATADRIDADQRLVITRNGRADGSATEPRSFAFEDHRSTEAQSKAMSRLLERLDLAALASTYPPAGVDDLVFRVSYEGDTHEIGYAVYEAYDEQSHQVDQFLKLTSLVEDILLEGSGGDKEVEELVKGLKPIPPAPDPAKP